MPLSYLRTLTSTDRTERANQHLARYLVFVAGAANAGGFLAVRQYTSHMTGIVSSMADNLAIGKFTGVLTGLVAVLSFLIGAIVTTLLVRWGHAHGRRSEYALPLVLEAFMLGLFGLTGRVFAGNRVVGTVGLLCFTMGLQNAMITKISKAIIRTTHLTGMVTDIGIGLGRILFTRSNNAEAPIDDDVRRVRLLSSLVSLFFVGGITGALGFRYLGFHFTLPLAAVLILLAAVPLIDDLRMQTRKPLQP